MIHRTVGESGVTLESLLECRLDRIVAGVHFRPTLVRGAAANHAWEGACDHEALFDREEPPMNESKPKSVDTVPAQGFERSAERDAKSHQVIGEHSPEVERKIGEKMPDRK